MDLKKIMKVWITSFLVLFGMVELYQWFREFTLPLPVFILAGALLAIASNYGKLSSLSYGVQKTTSNFSPTSSSELSDAASCSNWNLPSNKPMSNPTQSQRSISFTIGCSKGGMNDKI